ncbi:MAG: Sapep family Mn(2+)-dependent dipeptidase [Bacilli bacterium]
MDKIESIFEQYINDLKQLIEIPSVLDEDSDMFPFGENVQKALEKMLEISQKIGFSTYIDPDGYYGYADIGEGEMFGVLGHLDVVPTGSLDNWNTDPFKLIRKDGKLYGRGTQDDKGPTLAAMYALKLLIDNGFKLSKKVRFIFGTDEESLWRGIAKYQEKEEMPKSGFSPDSTFPLVYAEKGLLQCILKGKSSGIVFSGGDAFNSVPSKVKYTLDHKDEFKKNLEENGFEFSDDLEVIGKAVHAQVADTGINAITRTFIAMKEICPNSNAINFVCETFGEDANATTIFGDLSDEFSGKLMFNLGKFNFNNESEELSIDIRIPVTIEKEVVVEKLTEIANKYGLEYNEYDWLRSIYVPKDSKLIANLMAAYQEVTGDMESEPKSSGGATYARAMDNCVAFGAVLKNSSKTEHQPNEHVVEEDIKVAMKIYMKAFEKLV